MTERLHLSVVERSNERLLKIAAERRPEQKAWENTEIIGRVTPEDAAWIWKMFGEVPDRS